MFGIEFRKSKFSTSVLRNNVPLKFKANNCCCVKQIYQEKNKSWYITINIPSDIVNLIKDIDSAACSHCAEKESHFLYSIVNNTLKVKVPYRYKKFECEFYNNDPY